MRNKEKFGFSEFGVFVSQKGIRCNHIVRMWFIYGKTCYLRHIIRLRNSQLIWINPKGYKPEFRYIESENSYIRKLSIQFAVDLDRCMQYNRVTSFSF